MIKKLTGALLGALILAETIYLVYPYIQRRQVDNFNCSASLVQHYSDEAYILSLNYMIRGNFGLVHITGQSDINPEKSLIAKCLLNCNVMAIFIICQQ